MNKDELFDLADQAWEQYEFNGRYSNQINMDNYDAVRHAFMQGYILGYTKEKP
jgi:hypothetical protein